MANFILARDEVLAQGKLAFNHFGYSARKKDQFMVGLRYVVEYLEELKQDYTESSSMMCVDHFNMDISISKCHNTYIRRSVRILNLFMQGENAVYKLCMKPRLRFFNGEIGSIAKEFINHVSTIKRLSAGTTEGYTCHLEKFCIFLDKERVSNISELNSVHFLRFFSSIHNLRHSVINAVKMFYLYLFDKKYITDDLSYLFKGVKERQIEKIPSIYLPNEVVKIEKAIDRSTSTGKRNYAIILLASRLGLRSSDIVNLKFENIDWDNNTISLTQVKTREIITLPLLNDVGNAIIDYVQHGRPNQSTKLKYVFVSQDIPYRKISTISFIVKDAIIKSGIDARGRHRGSYSLRHSLATKLMNNGAQLPTIKEVLGHKSIESSTYYLDVNLNSLLECSHDVPLVDVDFYNNLKPYML